MKLLHIILVICYLIMGIRSSNLNDILDKLDSVIYNKQEDLSQSIKNLLTGDEHNKENKKNNANIENLVRREIANTTEINFVESKPIYKSKITKGFNKDFFDPYEMTLKLMKFKEDNSKKLEVDKLRKDEVNNVIFDHLFLTNQGQPKLNIAYDAFKKEFILPEQIKREDDYTKFMRIESLLESMNFNENKENYLPNFKNPPILKGFESKLSSINQKDKKSKKEKITNLLIKKDWDDKYYSGLKDEAKIAIRAPPNFLY